MKIEMDEKELSRVSGGADYMNMKLPRLQSQFERACRWKRMDEVMKILAELQARGCYSWAKETAAKYGITSI